jgi:hypothetical protein
MCKTAFSNIAPEAKGQHPDTDSDDSDNETAPVNSIQALKTLHEAIQAPQMTKNMAMDSGFPLTFQLLSCFSTRPSPFTFFSYVSSVYITCYRIILRFTGYCIILPFIVLYYVLTV